jgi:uncharacterized protein (DUF2141 family)
MSSCGLSTILSVTGDCQSTTSGAFSLDIVGTAPDYTIVWNYPITSTIPLGPSVTNYSEYGLSAGTYTFTVYDSCSPSVSVLVSLYISSGTCVSISHEINTICGLNNGSLTAYTQNIYSNPTFYLYETTNGYISSGSSFTNEFIFNGLEPGVYYVIADDGGGCEGISESCVIKSSSTLNFGFYVVNDAGCTTDSGKIFITGLTGSPPYSYLWSNGETSPSITGLTSGTYSVTVTDNTGCSYGSGTTVFTVPHIGFASVTSISPSCFLADGSVTVTVTGGTAPFYFSGTNGESVVTFSTSYTFNNLNSGYFSVSVTDAGLCNAYVSTSVLTPGGFSLISVTTTQSICGNNTGSISIVLLGGTPDYIYSITGSSGTVISTTSSSPNYIFNNLPADIYSLEISDNGPCVYYDVITITTEDSFTLTTSITGATCNEINGEVEVTITSGGTAPYLYQLNGQSVTTTDLSYLFTNLNSGNYVVSVTDATGCTQNENIVIPDLSSIDFILYGTNPTDGNNDGIINIFITEGNPPFTINWSSNVNGQTGLTITNLSAGTYSVTITDSDGCTLFREITLEGYNIISNYGVFGICSETFAYNGVVTKKGPQQMLIEGFYDLTSGDYGCILNGSIFTAIVEVSGVTAQTSFYTGTTLGDFPADNVVTSTIENLILGFAGIDSVSIDLVGNKITISTGCSDQTISFVDVNVKISINIFYDISCVACGP